MHCNIWRHHLLLEFFGTINWQLFPIPAWSFGTRMLLGSCTTCLPLFCFVSKGTELHDSCSYSLSSAIDYTNVNSVILFWAGEVRYLITGEAGALYYKFYADFAGRQTKCLLAIAPLPPPNSLLCPHQITHRNNISCTTFFGATHFAPRLSLGQTWTTSR